VIEPDWSSARTPAGRRFSRRLRIRQSAWAVRDAGKSLMTGGFCSKHHFRPGRCPRVADRIPPRCRENCLCRTTVSDFHSLDPSAPKGHFLELHQPREVVSATPFLFRFSLGSGEEHRHNMTRPTWRCHGATAIILGRSPASIWKVCLRGPWSMLRSRCAGRDMRAIGGRLGRLVRKLSIRGAHP
jgi:hypothetical protein